MSFFARLFTGMDGATPQDSAIGLAPHNYPIAGKKKSGRPLDLKKHFVDLIDNARDSAKHFKIDSDDKLPWQQKGCGNWLSTPTETLTWQRDYLYSRLGYVNVSRDGRQFTRRAFTQTIWDTSEFGGAWKAAVAKKIASIEMKLAAIKVEADFKDDLVQWIQGEGPKEEYNQCRWRELYNKLEVQYSATADPTKKADIWLRLEDAKRVLVHSYPGIAEGFIRDRDNQRVKTSTFLSWLARKTPTTEEEAALYYKYIVRKSPVDFEWRDAPNWVTRPFNPRPPAPAVPVDDDQVDSDPNVPSPPEDVIKVEAPPSPPPESKPMEEDSRQNYFPVRRNQTSAPESNEDPMEIELKSRPLPQKPDQRPNLPLYVDSNSKRIQRPPAPPLFEEGPPPKPLIRPAQRPPVPSLYDGNPSIIQPKPPVPSLYGDNPVSTPKPPAPPAAPTPVQNPVPRHVVANPALPDMGNKPNTAEMDDLRLRLSNANSAIEAVEKSKKELEQSYLRKKKEEEDKYQILLSKAQGLDGDNRRSKQDKRALIDEATKYKEDLDLAAKAREDQWRADTEKLVQEGRHHIGARDQHIAHLKQGYEGHIRDLHVQRNQEMEHIKAAMQDTTQGHEARLREVEQTARLREDQLTKLAREEIQKQHHLSQEEKQQMLAQVNQEKQQWTNEFERLKEAAKQERDRAYHEGAQKATAALTAEHHKIVGQKDAEHAEFKQAVSAEVRQRQEQHEKEKKELQTRLAADSGVIQQKLVEQDNEIKAQREEAARLETLIKQQSEYTNALEQSKGAGDAEAQQMRKMLEESHKAKAEAERVMAQSLSEKQKTEQAHAELLRNNEQIRVEKDALHAESERLRQREAELARQIEEMKSAFDQGKAHYERLGSEMNTQFNKQYAEMHEGLQKQIEDAKAEAELNALAVTDHLEENIKLKARFQEQTKANEAEVARQLEELKSRLGEGAKQYHEKTQSEHALQTRMHAMETDFHRQFTDVTKQLVDAKEEAELNALAVTDHLEENIQLKARFEEQTKANEARAAQLARELEQEKQNSIRLQNSIAAANQANEARAAQLARELEQEKQNNIRLQNSIAAANQVKPTVTNDSVKQQIEELKNQSDPPPMEVQAPEFLDNEPVTPLTFREPVESKRKPSMSGKWSGAERRGVKRVTQLASEKAMADLLPETALRGRQIGKKRLSDIGQRKVNGPKNMSLTDRDKKIGAMLAKTKPTQRAPQRIRRNRQIHTPMGITV